MNQAGATEELVTLFEQIKEDVVNGTDLKVDSGYVPTKSKNAPSAYKDGKYVTDEVASGLKKKIFAGPFSKSEVPKNITIKPICS